MNSLPGKIVTIEVSGNLSLVTIEAHPKILIKAIVVETPKTADYLKKGNPVKTLFKETEVIIGTTEDIAISLQNKIPGTITQLHSGNLLSKLVINTMVGEITAIISSEAVNQLSLSPNKSVTAMIKLNEVMLSKA